MKVVTPKKAGPARPVAPNPTRRDMGNLAVLSPEGEPMAYCCTDASVFMPLLVWLLHTEAWIAQQCNTRQES